MSTQIDYLSADPEVARSLYDGAKVLAKSGIDPKLMALVGMRASQLNGCAFCLALHRREGEALGESSDRMFGLDAWREAPWYSARERAALEWTEAITLIAKEHPSENLLSRMLEHFSERELVNLTMVVALVNTWNRFNVGFRTSPERAEAAFKQLHPQATLAHA
jgi:AhpD family alkylhydroperoxidase